MGWVQVEVWRSALREIVPASTLESLDRVEAGERWSRHLSAPAPGDPSAWVALVDHSLVGIAAAGPTTDDEAQVGEVRLVNVVASHQHKGVGRGLVDAAVAGLVEAQHARAVAWLPASDALAGGFFHSLGWRPDRARRTVELCGVAVSQIRWGIQW